MRYLKLIACLLLLSVHKATANNVLTERYNITCLDLAAGLPHNHVNQIFADSQGFVWISTYGGGAVRYDGYTFMRPVLNRYTGAGSNSCKGFAEDRHHRLWIAFDEGVMVVNLRTMDSTIPVYGTHDISNHLRQTSVKVYCDSKGSLWQLTRDSVFRYTFAEDGSVTHISRCAYHGNTPDVTVNDIEHNGTVWINIENGLYRLSEVGDILLRKDIAPAFQQLKGHYVTDILRQGSTIWISTNMGLFAYDQYTSTLKAYRHTGEPGSLSHEYATSLAVTPEGRLLVGTLRGINIMDERGNTFEHWNTATEKNPIPSNFIHCLMMRDGQIWIGTETAGVVKLSPQPLMVRNYAHEHSNPYSLSANPVNAIFVEPSGTVWVGTVEGGLNRKGADGGFIHWTKDNSQLPHNSVSVLEPDSHGTLWIGTWGGGVSDISLHGPTVVTPIQVPAHMVTLVKYIGSLAYDKYNDALWIGSNDGIFLYDIKTRRLTDPFQGNREIRGCIGSHIDRKGQLWMGCLSGVCIVDLHSGKTGGGKFRYRHLAHKLDQPSSPVIDKISCFCEAKDGTLWLGSNGYGFYRRVVDAADGMERFEVLTTEDGLVNNAVKGIVEDEQGRLWITTDNGLSVYDPRSHTFNNYGQQDGLLSGHLYNHV